VNISHIIYFNKKGLNIIILYIIMLLTH